MRLMLFPTLGSWLSTLLISMFFSVLAENYILAAEPLTIKAITGLQYDVKRFAVEPGATVNIVFVNDDSTDMPHNLVFTKPGKRMDVVNASLTLGADAAKFGFVPQMPEVIASIPEVKPHATAKLSFKAPNEKGIYPYVCTYPGHGLIMFGDMFVGVPMPAIKPESTTNAPANPHAFPLIRPYLYRLFMPDSNPASVAIMLPGELNLCWDAANCRPRYLWRGAGVDNVPYWKGNGSGRVELIGEKVWTAGAQHPLRWSTNTVPVIAFKGYALIQGYPEFHYTIDGVLVKELVKEHDGGKGLTSAFVVDSDKPLFYVVDAAQNALFTSSIGTFVNGTLAVAAKQGRSFSVTLIPAAKETK